MAKTKISEFSTTAGNNTDINSINIAEGCAPSGINDAIRELMRQLKEFQTGGAGDSVNSGGDFSVATNKFTVASASGNTAVAGTLAVTGVATLTAQPILSSLTASKAVFTDASKGLVSNDVTGTGNVVMSNSPTLVTPALGTPSSGVVTNLTGTASININGTVGATTPSTGAFTTLSSTGNTTLGDASGDTITVNGTTTFVNANPTLSAGTANGVLYLDGSKVATSGSALVFNGTQLGINISPTQAIDVSADAPAIAAFRSIGSSGNDKRLLITSGGDNIRLDSANQTGGAASMAFSVGSSEGMRLTSTGLGIGTSSPATKLDVQGSSPFARVKENTTGYMGFRGQNDSGNFYFGIDSSTGSFYGSAYARVLYSDGAYPMVFYTNATERMRLDSSGNLGLGVTPSAWNNSIKALQVNNAALASFTNGGNVQTWLANNAYYDNATGWLYKNSSVGAALYAQNFNGSHNWNIAPSGTAGNAITFTQAMTLDASGRLGIGATSLTEYLTVKSPNASTFFSLQTATDSGVYMGNNAGALTLLTASTERARIDSSGNFLIGKTGLSDTGAGFAFGGGSNAGLSYFARSSGIVMSLHRYTTTGDIVRFVYDGSPVGTISVTGSATAYNTSSDYRLKDNQQPLTGSGAFIDALQPKTWNWKADGSRGVGFIAHEVQEVSPGSVVGEKDGEQMQAMEYGSAEFIANIIAELQSLRKRLADAGIA